ncbi:MAG: hypothetical protein KF688_13200 [Pirellulales bacterium]|nr:hypothetical protein [Pirellulales bacterium]
MKLTSLLVDLFRTLWQSLILLIVAGSVLDVPLVGLRDAAAAEQGAESPNSFWPAVTRETKPWTRWWWHGSAVDAGNLTRQLEAYAAAGVGGVEITPIYGVRGTENRFLDYLAPEWMSALEHTLDEAERLGLGVDMATGNGWPFGGPWVEPDAACRNLVIETWRVAGGERLAAPVQFTQAPMVRAIGRRLRIDELNQPLRDNDDLQGLALEQVRFPRPLPLAALAAVSKSGETLQLADRVGADGTLDWTAPPGEWTLYAAFMGWHGKLVERAGPGGEGDVIDHFSRDALTAYLKKFDAAFADREIATLRGFFNDSYEVDDASGESDWTPEFFAQFERRRGYDLREELPALTGEGEPDRSARVLCDFRETISDLLLDEFTEPWAEWARSHGAIIRNQAHGSPANLLDLYAASDIPETEGEDRIKFLTAASAAHVTGKPLASAEACTWIDEHFVETLADTKRWVDRYFLGGINHVCYHGTPYTPTDAPWPGWLFYASGHYGTTNSWWPHFHALNEYVTRCQSLLQAGKPDSDVLVYYPIHDQWSQRGRTRLVHFDGSMQGNAARQCAERLLAGGYLLDFVSDRQLENVAVEGGKLQTGGIAYQAIVVPPCRALPIATLEKLATLAEQGAMVVFEGEALPSGPPGLGDLAKRQVVFDELIGRFNSAAGEAGLRMGAPISFGAGRLILDDAVVALTKHAVAGEPLAVAGLQFTRRRLEDGCIYFIVNSNEQEFDGAVALARRGRVVRLDPANGRTSAVLLQRAGDGFEFGVTLRLAAGESCLLRTFDKFDPPAALRHQVWPPRRLGDPQTLVGTWEAEFIAGGPEKPAAMKLDALASWTDLPDDRGKSFSGTARYTTRFNTPMPGAALELDLGEVRESAAVTVNGRAVGTLFAPPYRVVVDRDMLLLNGNVLVVEVANLMANRIAAMEQAGDASWKKFYNINFPSKGAQVRGGPNPNRGPDGLFTAKHWQPRPSGLLGPVTIRPVVGKETP